MATIQIPTPGSASLSRYQIEVVLDGTVFKIDLRFNSRQESWFMTLRDLNGVVLRSGVPVVSGFPLLLRMKGMPRPAGAIIAVPISDDSISAPGLAQLGSDVLLVYGEVL